MDNIFSRTELLIGETGLNKLRNANVIVFGAGGVGGYVIEAFARSGIGAIDIVDNDKVCPSNLNRQIIATFNTIGKFKVDAAKDRILSINPDCRVNCYKIFYTPETSSTFDLSQYDYIVDAIDTVSGKIELVIQAEKANVPIISSMGAGNKMHPEMFEISDIYKTSVCPLAKVMRAELKKRNIKHLKVVFSKETPIKPESEKDNFSCKRVPGSNAFTPAAAGLIIAGEVIRDLLK